MATEIKLKLPICVIMYDTVTATSQRLYALSSATDAIILPIFTSISAAEVFRIAAIKLLEILPISVTESAQTHNAPLNLYVVSDPQALRDTLDIAMLMCKSLYVTVDPVPGSEPYLCYELDEIEIIA